MIKRLFTLLPLLTILAACQNTQRLEPVTALGQIDLDCQRLIGDFSSTVNKEGVNNASTRPVQGFPLLQVNRFLDAVAGNITTEQQLTDWLAQAMPLSLESRYAENVNLTRPWNEAEMASLAECGQLAANDSQYRNALLRQLRAHSEVENNYITSRKWLGIYPLMRPFYLRSINKLHGEEKKWFTEAETFAETTLYTPAHERHELNGRKVGDWFSNALSNNSLAIPVLSNEELLQLFLFHAPDVEIEYAGNQDLIGSPVWLEGKLTLDTDSPQTFILSSYTNFAGRNLLQLNYVFWFPAREPRRLIDLYSGRFDGLIWRVTLDQSGQVLLYDSIHPCGCYHKYFVKSDQVKTLQQPKSSEPVNIFQVSDLDSDAPVKITLTSNEHFIVGLTNTAASAFLTSPNSKRYRTRHYDALTTLDNNGRAKSMFDKQGLVFDSQRLERFTLWSTGILSVGAMRQWGTHATGFIEEQQFDDYNLLDLYFDYGN